VKAGAAGYAGPGQAAGAPLPCASLALRRRPREARLEEEAARRTGAGALREDGADGWHRPAQAGARPASSDTARARPEALYAKMRPLHLFPAPGGATVARHSAPDPHLGHALEFVNPADGAP